MALPFGYGEHALRDIFEIEAGRPVKLTITDNSACVLSVAQKNGVIYVRLHWCFLEADPDVISEIAVYISRLKGRTPLLWEFIKRNRVLIRVKPTRRVKPRTKGAYHDLASCFDGLNRGYFGGRLSCTVTWGAARPRRFVKTRTLGSYSSPSHTIRINPVLDRRRVPGYFIEYVLYHEMLHAEMGAEDEDEARRIIHNREFKERERAFKHYGRAINWLNKNI